LRRLRLHSRALMTRVRESLPATRASESNQSFGPFPGSGYFLLDQEQLFFAPYLYVFLRKGVSVRASARLEWRALTMGMRA